jgi:hypothetical protein
MSPPPQIYCDMHAVVLFQGNKGGYLVTTNGHFLGIRSEKVSSLRSGPRLYISDNVLVVKAVTC